MAITDTLTNIKEFFCNWHREHYTDIHEKKTTQVTNQSPNNELTVTSGAVYNALNQQKQTFQTTLDNYNTQINQTIDDKIANATKNIKVAQYGTLPNVVEECDTYFDDDSRGFNWPNFDNQAANGFITPSEKADLYYMGKWYEVTGKTIGTETSTTKYMTMWINVGLRLVYFNFFYKNCPLLKNAYKNLEEKYWFSYPYNSSNELFYQVRPIRNIYAPTSIHDVYITVHSDGQFRLWSTKPITKNINVSGSLMWFYRDSAPSNKIGTYI